MPKYAAFRMGPVWRLVAKRAVHSLKVPFYRRFAGQGTLLYPPDDRGLRRPSKGFPMPRWNPALAFADAEYQHVVVSRERMLKAGASTNSFHNNGLVGSPNRSGTASAAERMLPIPQDTWSLACLGTPPRSHQLPEGPFLRRPCFRPFLQIPAQSRILATGVID